MCLYSAVIRIANQNLLSAIECPSLQVDLIVKDFFSKNSRIVVNHSQPTEDRSQIVKFINSVFLRSRSSGLCPGCSAAMPEVTMQGGLGDSGGDIHRISENPMEELNSELMRISLLSLLMNYHQLQMI